MQTVDWQPFSTFVDTLRGASEPRELLGHLLRGLVGMLRVSRGVVLLREGGGDELTSVASHVEGPEDDLAAVSRTVAARALESGDIVFVDGDVSEEWFAQASAASQALLPRAILCAPLRARGGSPFGVVYLDGFAGRTDVTRERIPFVEVVAGLAAELVAAAQTRRALLSARGRLASYGEVVLGEPLVLGPSSASRDLDRLVDAAAAQDVSVLITGETGTGKEMVARELHRRSRRRTGLFVPVNCAALPPDIIEAELFGVEKGAYTGASQSRAGRFEVAAGGTIFLDEVGELEPAIQVKLLRVLQERTVTRLGGVGAIPLDVRLVCATNRDLEAAVREGSFRQDMYYRINVFRLHLPPLRDRREDLEPLARHFLADLSRQFGKRLEGFAADALARLQAHDWPGNVRELRNAVERAAVVETGPLVRAASLPIGGPGLLAGGAGASADGGDPFGRMVAVLEGMAGSFEEAHDVFEKAFLSLNLERFGGNVSRMIRETGIPRNTLYRRFAKYGLQNKDE